jgi:hypothetical protein
LKDKTFKTAPKAKFEDEKPKYGKIDEAEE